jgi:hypothetical protein
VAGLATLVEGLPQRHLSMLPSPRLSTFGRASRHRVGPPVLRPWSTGAARSAARTLIDVGAIPFRTHHTITPKETRPS